MDPLSLVMFGLIAVLIFFMFRNGKKRQQAQQEMQNNLRPGAEVMLQSGIFATVESVDDEENRVTVRSGDSSLVVHRNAIGQIITPAETGELAPDDDPAFGERIEEAEPEQLGEAPATEIEAPEAEQPETGIGEPGEGETPKA